MLGSFAKPRASRFPPGMATVGATKESLRSTRLCTCIRYVRGWCAYRRGVYSWQSRLHDVPIGRGVPSRRKGEVPTERTYARRQQRRPALAATTRATPGHFARQHEFRPSGRARQARPGGEVLSSSQGGPPTGDHGYHASFCTVRPREGARRRHLFPLKSSLRGRDKRCPPGVPISALSPRNKAPTAQSPGHHASALLKPSRPFSLSPPRPAYTPSTPPAVSSTSHHHDGRLPPRCRHRSRSRVVCRARGHRPYRHRRRGHHSCR